MARRNFKRGSGPKFVQLEHWVMDCDAWRDMKPGPRSLYLELKRKFNGVNNGNIFLSHRDAAKLLCVGRDTVGQYFQQLVEHGYIVETRGHCLGPVGVGQSASYALTELPVDEKPATKDFRQWKKQNPRRKTRHSLAGKSDTPCRKIQHSKNQTSENPAALGRNLPEAVSENPAIYTSNHIPTENAGEVIPIVQRSNSNRGPHQ